MGEQHGQLAEGFNRQMASWRYQAIAQALGRFNPDTCLDLGCGKGDLTVLFGRHMTVTGIDLERKYITAARRQCGQLDPAPRLVCADLWDWEPPTRLHYDLILAVDLLEHVVDPVALLQHIRPWLAQGGRLAVVVPNACSLHRLLGVSIGRLQSQDVLGDADLAVGHRRVYTRGALGFDLDGAGYRVVREAGILLKPVPNREMSRLSRETLEELYVLGLNYPDHCAELLAIAEPRP